MHMPSIAHLVLGAIFALSFYYVSEGKFTKTHAFILFMNNYLGPDVGWVVGLGQYTHTLVFYPLFALILALFYHFFTKFSLSLDGIKHIELIELKEHKLTYLNTYLLVLAGGWMHNYLDGMFNRGGVFLILPPINGAKGLSYDLFFFMEMWAKGAGQLNLILSVLMGICFIFGMIFVFVFALKKETIASFLSAIIFMAAFMVLFYVAGSIVTLLHADAGAILHISLFWLPIMGLIPLSTREWKFTEKFEISSHRKKSTNGSKTLLFVASWIMLIGILVVFISILGFMFNEQILAFLYSLWEEEISMYLTEQEVLNLLVGGEIFILVLGMVNMVCSIGLGMKHKILWRFTIYYHLLLAWTLVGLAIACLLSKDAVKELFPN